VEGHCQAEEKLPGVELKHDPTKGMKWKSGRKSLEEADLLHYCIEHWIFVLKWNIIFFGFFEIYFTFLLVFKLGFQFYYSFEKWLSFFPLGGPGGKFLLSFHFENVFLMFCHFSNYLIPF
jgi:hypothetical protein